MSDTENGRQGTPPPAKRQRLNPTPAVAKKTLPYSSGLHLAPMVRIGTLPTRLLSLKYGATLVWGPEIVDKAILNCTRTVDPLTGTVSFLSPSNGQKSVFECHPIERSRVIFQLGSASPELAVQAAKQVMNDVAGIGLNCGCPKPFSVKGGMGAALLSEPAKLCAILKNLVQEIPLPIDCKIRLLSTQAATISLVSQIVVTGISALTVHCRTQDMRSREPALLERLKEIVDFVKPWGIPVIANGDCFGREDYRRICEITGVKAVMVARGAEANPSCFSPSFVDPPSTLIPLYLRMAIATAAHFHNAKYCLNALDLAKSPTPLPKRERNELKQKMQKAKTWEEMCDVFEVDWEKAKTEKVKDVVPELVGLTETPGEEATTVKQVEGHGGEREEGTVSLEQLNGDAAGEEVKPAEGKVELSS